MHGRSGEDGTVQELLDILGIPYTGSDVLPSIRCMDKVLSKHSFVADGIPTPPFYAFNRDAFQELGAVDTMPIIGEELGFPIVVKPAAQGSALGIRFAHNVERAAGGADLRVQFRQQGAAGEIRKGPRAGGQHPRQGAAGAADRRGQAQDRVLRFRIALHHGQGRLPGAGGDIRRRGRRRSRSSR